MPRPQAESLHDIVMIDHAFHQRTRSTQFLIDMLQGDTTKVIYVEPDAPNVLQLLQANPSRALVFIQLRPAPRLLRALGHRNVTWVPMRDDLRYELRGVRKLAGSSIKLVNFCREAHTVFQERGQPSLGVTYWPKPQTVPQRTGRVHPRILLWDRGQVQWPLLKQLIGDQPIDSVVLRLAPDPGRHTQRPSDEDVRQYRIELVEGWLEHDAYLDLLHDCDVFVAPRWLEGIGMAMLGAMSAGQAVLAPDRPTMNEYVVHSHNGWLYEPDRPAQIDLSAWQALGQHARQDCETGAAAWDRQKGDIRPFVLGPSPRRERLWWRLARWAGR